MKQRLTILAATVCAATASAQTSSVTIYGVLDADVRYVRDSGKGSLWTMGSGGTQASRLGFRGTEDLGAGWAAGFALETSPKVDTGANGTNTQFWDRLSYLRLSNTKLGEVRLGLDYTPTYNIWSPADPFFQTGMATNSNAWPIQTANALGAPFGSTDRSLGTLSRSRNSVAYTTPQGLGGFSATVMMAPGEGSAVGTTGANKFASGRLGYANGPLSLAVGVSRTKNDVTGPDSLRELAAHAIYDFSVVKLALATRQFDYRTTSVDIYTLGLWAPVGKVTIKGGFTKVKLDGRIGATSNVGKGSTQVALGAEYALSRRTALYANVARLSNKGTFTAALNGGTGSSLPGGSSSGYDIGLRHSF